MNEFVVRFFLCAVCVLCGSLPATAATNNYSIQFDQASYQLAPGVPLNVNAVISPVPASGLYSFGVLVTLQGNNITGTGFSVSVPAALNFHSVRGAGADQSVQGQTVIAKGSVDFHREPYQAYAGSVLATVSIPGLPAGTYTLSIAPKNDLGPTEQIFVDGSMTGIDGSLAFVSSQIVVAASAPAITFNRQTGLFEQKYHLVNPFAQTQTGLRVVLHNIPAKVQVWNAAGTLNGLPYIVYSGTLAPGASVDLTVQYYIADGKTMPQTQFEVLAPAGQTQTPVGSVTAVTPRFTFPNRNVLLEFRGIANQLYFVQYSSDLTTWKTVLPALTATGTSQQWTDYGPPGTESLPSTARSRFYRILRVNP